MKPLDSVRPALFLLLGWIVLQGILFVYSVATGEVLVEMLAAVDRSGMLAEGAGREQTAWEFVYISVAWFVVINSLAAYSFYRAYAGSKPWLFFFVVAGGWSLYEAASSPFVLGTMYPGSIHWRDWLLAAAGSGVWFLLFMSMAARWRGAT